MSRDASLDEFVGGSAAEGEESDEEQEESEEVAVEEPGTEEEGVDDAEVVSSASATYAWTPAGDSCARCGDSADRLWRCSEELVCGECKEW